jgi:hypothetical protein
VFSDCTSIDLEATGTSASAGIILQYCDFRSQAAATPIASAKYYPNIYQSTAKAGGITRLIDSCTWDTNNGTNPTALYVRSPGHTMSNCVLNNAKHHGQSSYADHIWTRNFITSTYTAASEFFSATAFLPNTYTRNYYLNRHGDHPYGSTVINGTASPVITDSIFETDDVTNIGASNGIGTNWFLFNSGTSTGTWAFSNNLVLGSGNTVVFTSNNTGGTWTINGNTFYVDNDGTLGSGLFFAPILLTEQTATNIGGTVNIHSNLVVDPDDTTGSRDAAIDLVGSTADQVDFLQYNCGYSFVSGITSPVMKYTANVNVTSGKGTNDFSANPQFIDRTRNFKKWVQSLGRSTIADGVTAMLKLNAADFNANYTVAALLTYVWRGFRPQNTALATAGYLGQRVGAKDPLDLASDYPTTWSPVNTYTLASIAGLVRWVDYIPVQQVTPASQSDVGTTNADGALYTNALSSISGLVRWVDYKPVYVTADPASGRNRYDNNGWIPVTNV